MAAHKEEVCYPVAAHDLRKALFAALGSKDRVEMFVADEDVEEAHRFELVAVREGGPVPGVNWSVRRVLHDEEEGEA